MAAVFFCTLLAHLKDIKNERNTLFYLLLAQLIVQFSEFCPTELIWILQSGAILFLFPLVGNSNRLFPKSGKAVGICVKLACVASVSVGFPHKFRCFGRAKIGARAKKKEGGGREEKRKCLQSNPCNLKTPFASERGS